MKLIRIIFNYKTLLILMGILIALLLATRFVDFSASEEEIKEAFAQTSYTPIDHYSEFDEGKLHYITAGDSTKPSLILIHGSPGSWDAWLALITETNMLERFYVIAIDRAGYNKTTLGGDYSLAEQSAFLKPIVDQYCDDCVVAGHSYGGGLAFQVGLDYENKVDAMISIAGTIAAPFQKLKWYNYAMRYSPAKWLVASDFSVSDNEMWNLQEDLPIMNDRLGSYKGKVAIIQGNEDILVNKESAQYAESKLVNASVKMIIKDDMDHFVIWSDKDLVTKALTGFSLGIRTKPLCGLGFQTPQYHKQPLLI